MDDTEGIGSMLGFQNSDLLGSDDIKSILWDDESFANISAEHQSESDMLNLITSTDMSPSNSSDNLQDDSDFSKRVILAAASAAGLNKGGLRRAAFSMGDLQALQPAEVKREVQQQLPSFSGRSGSYTLETVHEGQPSIISSLPQTVQSIRVVQAAEQQHRQHQQQPQQPQQPQQQPQQHQQQPQQQYVLMPLHEAAARGSTPTQLASMSIEEIEAQLRRTREAAAATAEHTRPAMMEVPAGLQMPPGSQPMRYYTVVPSTGALQELQPSQLVGLMQQQQQQHQPSTSGAGGPVSVSVALPASAGAQYVGATTMLTAAPAGIAPVMSAPSMRRVKSAVELRPRAGNEDSGARPVVLQTALLGDSVPDDGVYRIGKLTPEERRQKILRYRQKRHERNFKKKIKYVCRKTLADSRPRVRGRFARNTDEDAKMPPAQAK